MTSSGPVPGCHWLPRFHFLSFRTPRREDAISVDRIQSFLIGRRQSPTLEVGSTILKYLSISLQVQKGPKDCLLPFTMTFHEPTNRIACLDHRFEGPKDTQVAYYFFWRKLLFRFHSGSNQIQDLDISRDPVLAATRSAANGRIRATNEPVAAGAGSRRNAPRRSESAHSEAKSASGTSLRSTIDIHIGNVLRSERIGPRHRLHVHGTSAAPFCGRSRFLSPYRTRLSFRFYLRYYRNLAKQSFFPV